MPPPFPPFLPFPGPHCPPIMPPLLPFPSDGDLVAPPGFPMLPPPPAAARHRVDIESVTDYRPRRDGSFARYERLSVTSDAPIAAVTWSTDDPGPPPPPMLRRPLERRRALDPPPPPPPYPCECSRRLSERFDRDRGRGRAPSIVPPSEACSRCSCRSSRARSLSASPPPPRPLLLDAPPGSSAGWSSYRRAPQPTRSPRVFDLDDLASSLAETETARGRGRSGGSTVRSHSASPTRRSSRASSASRASRNWAPPPSTTTTTARWRKRDSYASTRPLSAVDEDGAPPPSYVSRWAARRARSREGRSAAGTSSTVRPESSVSKMTARSSRRGSGHQRY